PFYLLNSLIIKEFFVQAAPEVARIIEPFEQPSILISIRTTSLFCYSEQGVHRSDLTEVVVESNTV
ncbi:hypothetical protein BZL41_20110, partial [Pseudomonas sp. PIC25]|uniref:hypothetical protein n=1 Tax=Pseudomonas sp. PIC25 TaxID=1958773 RepID=UPI000BDD7F82